MALHKTGYRLGHISYTTGLSHITMRRWIQSGTLPEMSTLPRKTDLLAPWREWQGKQQENGDPNASRIWR